MVRLYKNKIRGFSLPIDTPYEGSTSLNNSGAAEHFLLPTDAHNFKNVELLKHSKINKNAPTCFGLHGNHLQGAKVSTWLKVTRLVNSRCVKDVQGIVSAMAAYCDLYGVCVVHCVRVYRVFILECFNNSTYFSVVCISW